MEAKTRKAARGPREPSLVLDEVEGLPRGNGREGSFASSAPSRTVRTGTRDIL